MEGDAHLIAEKSPIEEKPDKLLIKKKGKEFVVSLDQISTIQSGGNYIYIHTNNQVYPMRSTMNKMQEKLDPNHFIRVHRSYIVNSNFIQEILTINPQEYKIKLKNNETIPLSRNRRSELLKVFYV
jgi:DNA-binding LytR/AlgR family response regulator